MAVAGRDEAALRRITLRYADIGRFDEALSVCDDIAKLSPGDVRTLLLRAAVLARAGRSSDVLPLLEKAIELNPNDLRIYIDLARMLDQEEQHDRALQVLERMTDPASIQRHGEAARTRSLFEQGSLLARWGLPAQSLQRFQELAKRQRTGIPDVQLAIGRALAALGETKQAREILGEISPHCASISGHNACWLP